MKKSLSKAVSLSAAALLVGTLAACGGDSDSSRNRNSALDPVACLDGSTGSLTSENTLKISTCETAVKFSIVGSDETDGDQQDIADGSVTLPVIGRGPVTVKTFNAAGAVIAKDVVKPNGSRGGIIYRIDTSGANPVYYEAAPKGWSGTTSDPRTVDGGIQPKIDEFNSASTPTADWYLGNEWEMRTILSNTDLSVAVGISGGDGNTFYWTSKRPCSICALLIERPSIAQRGYIATYAYGSWTNNFVRPIRSFTSGTEVSVSVVPLIAPTQTSEVTTPATTEQTPTSTTEQTPTSTTDETTTTTMAIVPTTVALEPEVQLVVNVINPNIEVVELPAEEVTISVTPALVEEWVSGGVTAEIKAVEVSFDGAKYSPISMDTNSSLVIPASATEATLRVTTDSGELVEIEKTLQRTGEAGVDTTTTTSTVAPIPADDVVDETEASNTVGTETESSSSTIWVILGAVVVLGAAGAAFQLRRKKK
jgi:hypothetical protein